MRRFLFQPQQKYRLLLLLGDAVIIIGSFSLIAFLETYVKRSPRWEVSHIVAVCFIIAVITIMAFYILDLYELSEPKGSEIIFLAICLGLGITITLYSALSYFFIFARPGKLNLLCLALMNGMLTFAWRTSFGKFIHIRPQRLLFIGNDPIFDDISRVIQSKYSKYYTITRHWHRLSHNPTLPNLVRFIEENNIDLIAYSARSQAAQQCTADLSAVKFRRKNIIDAYYFYQGLTRKFPACFLDEFWVLANAQREMLFPAAAAKLKRAFDILFVLLFVPTAVPLVLLAALAIKVESGGPVFFTQERLGRNEIPFRLYKLRTMIHNAEALTGPRWSASDDPRITRVGRILRKLRLDELPQLINVLRGEMSVVGPRPIRRHFADMLSREIPFYRLRFRVKPGLTGWAQVNHDYAGSKEGQEEKLQYDLFYLVHRSLWLDLLIVLKTVKVMVRGKGT